MAKDPVDICEKVRQEQLFLTLQGIVLFRVLAQFFLPIEMLQFFFS